MTRLELETIASLRERKSELMDDLIRRAIAQNPDIADKLMEVDERYALLIETDLHRRVARWHRICEENHRRRVAERHIRYDDGRNINKLSGLRRSCVYVNSTRLEQIQMEIDEYYAPYHQPIPRTIMNERDTLLACKPKSMQMMSAFSA